MADARLAADPPAGCSRCTGSTAAPTPANARCRCDGYRGSRPVRVGNAAADQLQLDTYGELLQTAWLYAEAGNRLDADIGRRLAQVADLVCRLWRRPDAGIWEVRSEPAHFTHSKMMCWVALDRAARLADRGLIPARHARRWREQAAAIQHFIEARLLLHAAAELRALRRRRRAGRERAAGPAVRLRRRPVAAVGGTVAAVRRELGHGPLRAPLHRRRRARRAKRARSSAARSGSPRRWPAPAASIEATALMDELVALANDVGLYAEEIDPATGAFLGNLPQALSHLSLISAALAIAEERSR